jgi:hypothetical protein
VASASIDHPDGKVKEVIYPIAGEQTLRDLIQEFKLNSSYEQQVQTIMRGSYSNHYRRMVPVLLKALTFCSTNEASKSMLITLDLIRRYADKNQVHYAEAEQVPLENIVPGSWLPLVKQGQRINRISYELCVLKTLCDKLRCKEMYAQEAYRYRNPDEDLLSDFSVRQKEYYADLHQPLSADEFIATQKKQAQEALTMLDRGMLNNKKVEIISRNGKSWIKVSPLDPQPEPRNLASIKAEVGNRWSQVYLLDILKEADLRIGFTNLFKSPTSHEILSSETLQVRLLLCLYGLGTNAWIKRVASGAQINYRDLLYVLRRLYYSTETRDCLCRINSEPLYQKQKWSINSFGLFNSISCTSFSNICLWSLLLCPFIM